MGLPVPIDPVIGLLNTNITATTKSHAAKTPYDKIPCNKTLYDNTPQT